MSEILYEDDNGYIYEENDRYKIHWKRKEFEPENEVSFDLYNSAYFYLRSVN